MRQELRACVITLALCIIGNAAYAQRGPGTAHTDLTQTQQQAVSDGLANQPAQSSPSNYQAQVGAKVPDSMHGQQMPNNVASQVPETKNLLFIKLPDRILLLDPDTQMVAEIIPDASASTGSSAGNGTGSGTAK